MYNSNDMVTKIIKNKITQNELKNLAREQYGDVVKAVVDIDRDLLAIDAQLHSDLEALLLGEGSKQKNLWGINLYPQARGEDFIEYDSMINVRPSSGNRSRGVENADIRKKVSEIVAKWATR